MPVTFRPAPHLANSLDAKVASAQGLLSSSCPSAWDGCDEILQSFLGRGPDAQSSHRLSPARKGLVTTISDAYNQHHALSLRPDDVWLAILVQFQLYVNAHAEELRDSFVAHEGKKEVIVRRGGNRYTVDFGDMAHEMTAEMDKHIVDPAVRDWILPRFSTTTHNDIIVAAVLMMATLKAYFDYAFELTCGIPQVTLEGSKEDWQELLRRVAKLNTYGEEPRRWYAMLVPVLTCFVRAFDDPHAQENLDFWQKVVHYQGGGSGPTWVSGWITAFCVFGSKGQWIGLSPSETPTTGSMKDIERDVNKNPFSRPKTALELDGAFYHVLDSKNITCGYAEVDVKLDDNGKVFATKMVAGLVATRVSDSLDVRLSPGGESDVIAPMPGWWIFTKREGEGRKAEEIRKMMEEWDKSSDV